MPRKKQTEPSEIDFEQMARSYRVSDNALFISTLDTYRLQKLVIESIKKEIENGDPTVEKEYVKGRLNLCVHPAVKELPIHVNSINKTAATLIRIIINLGSRSAQEGGDELEDFINS